MDFHIHDRRHQYASKLIQRGTEITRVQKLLGRKDLRMTQRYAHLAPQTLNDAVAVLDKWFPGAKVVADAETSGPITIKVIDGRKRTFAEFGVVKKDFFDCGPSPL